MVENGAVRLRLGTQHLLLVLSKDQWGVVALGLFLEYRTRLGRCLTDDYGNTALDDAGFLCGYLCQGVAQELGMVKADIGDDRQHGRDDVSAVQSSAKPHLDNGNVHLHVAEVLESHGCGQLEEGWVERLEEMTLMFYKPHDIVLADGVAVDADTFTEVNKMWGGIETDSIAAGLKNGSQRVGT